MRRLRYEVDMPELEAARGPQVAVLRRPQHERLVIGRPGETVDPQHGGSGPGLDHVGMVVGEADLVVSAEGLDPDVLELDRRAQALVEVDALPEAGAVDQQALDVDGARLSLEIQPATQPIVRVWCARWLRDRDAPTDQDHVVPTLDDEPAQASETVSRQPHD